MSNLCELSDYDWLVEYLEVNGAEVMHGPNLDGTLFVDVRYQGGVLASFDFEANGDFIR